MHALVITPQTHQGPSPLLSAPERDERLARGGHVTFEWHLGGTVDPEARRCAVLVRLHCESGHPRRGGYRAELTRVRRYHGGLDILEGPSLCTTAAAPQFDVAALTAFARSAISSVRARVGEPDVAAITRIPSSASVTESALPDTMDPGLWLAGIVGGPAETITVADEIELHHRPAVCGGTGPGAAPNDVAMGLRADTLAGHGLTAAVLELVGPVAVTLVAGTDVGTDAVVRARLESVLAAYRTPVAAAV